MKKKLSFKLFDGLKIYREDEQCWKSIVEFSEKGIGKKQQMFLTYFLLNHRRRISSAELIENFWGEKGDAPENSLKNMLHKTRKLLQLIFPECKELIVTQAGAYEWSRDYEIETDVELFEEYYKKLDYLTGEGQKRALAALDLYSGNILPGMSADWLDHFNTYYQALYIDISKSVTTKLAESEKWNQVLDICEHAYSLAPEVEEFTLCTMNAYIASNMAKQAIQHYEDYAKRLLEIYNLTPSEQVEKLHALAEEMYKEDDIEDKIMQRFFVPSEEKGAFQCGMLAFQNFVQLELRHMQRHGNSTCIILLQAETLKKNQASTTDIRRLERVIKSSLRSGDPFTRLNKGSFALLLAGADEDDSKRIAERIEKDFYSTYTRTHAILKFKIYALSIE